MDSNSVYLIGDLKLTNISKCDQVSEFQSFISEAGCLNKY